jgi:hypothetical protein
MSNDIEARIEARVREFVAELGALVREAAIASVNDALGGNGHARRGRGRPRGARPTGGRAKGQKRAPAELSALTTQLLAAIKRAPGSRIEQIGKAMSVPTKELTLPIRKLLANSSIKKRGQKRATAYYPK